jgi:hypothetical protein
MAASKVTWAMHGPNLYILKVMIVFVKRDRMMGGYFGTGLANLKAVAQSASTLLRSEASVRADMLPSVYTPGAQLAVETKDHANA